MNDHRVEANKLMMIMFPEWETWSGARGLTEPQEERHLENQTLARIDTWITHLEREIKWLMANTNHEELSNPHRAELTVKYIMALIRLIDQRMLIEGAKESHTELEKEMLAWIFKRKQEWEEMETAHMNAVVIVEEEPDSE